MRDVPLIARRPTRNRADTRAHFDIASDRPAALLSFGGYGLPSLDFARVDCLDAWTIVTTDRLRNESSARPANVVFVEESQFIDSGFRYEDLVGAVDVVMTKPGYGITAECIATNTAMLYTSRGEFREYPILVEGLRRFVRSRFIDQERLFAGAWLESLDALRSQPSAPERMDVNGADRSRRLSSSAFTLTRLLPREHQRRRDVAKNEADVRRTAQLLTHGPPEGFRRGQAVSVDVLKCRERPARPE